MSPIGTGDQSVSTRSLADFVSQSSLIAVPGVPKFCPQLLINAVTGEMKCCFKSSLIESSHVERSIKLCQHVHELILLFPRQHRWLFTKSHESDSIP